MMLQKPKQVAEEGQAEESALLLSQLFLNHTAEKLFHASERFVLVENLLLMLSHQQMEPLDHSESHQSRNAINISPPGDSHREIFFFSLFLINFLLRVGVRALTNAAILRASVHFPHILFICLAFHLPLK